MSVTGWTEQCLLLLFLEIYTFLEICPCQIYKNLYTPCIKIKPLKFAASSLDDLRNFPDEARRAAGFELHAIQSGLEPRDWKTRKTSKQDIDLARQR
jgi:hypothetical protein